MNKKSRQLLCRSLNRDIANEIENILTTDEQVKVQQNFNLSVAPQLRQACKQRKIIDVNMLGQNLLKEQTRLRDLVASTGIPPELFYQIGTNNHLYLFVKQLDLFPKLHPIVLDVEVHIRQVAHLVCLNSGKNDYFASLCKFRRAYIFVSECRARYFEAVIQTIAQHKDIILDYMKSHAIPTNLPSLDLNVGHILGQFFLYRMNENHSVYYSDLLVEITRVNSHFFFCESGGSQTRKRSNF